MQNAEAAAEERRHNRSASAPVIPVATPTSLQVPSMIPGLSIVRQSELEDD
jgi:hypothetical protein